jgi:hypothetical protein
MRQLRSVHRVFVFLAYRNYYRSTGAYLLMVFALAIVIQIGPRR